MINRREAKRFNMKFGKFLDPLALFLLIAVFILPALAVVNLSPKTKLQNNVLGAKSTQDISVVLVGGIHDYIKEERISFPTETKAIYDALIIKHDNGVYSKPILQISNTYSDSRTIQVSGGTTTPTDSPIYVIFQNKEYMIQDQSGDTKTVSIEVPSQSKDIMYLKIKTDIPLKFNEDISLNIVQK